MNTQAVQTLLESHLIGGFDVLQTLVGASFEHSIGDSRDVDVEQLAQAIGTHTVALKGNVLDGGTLAILYTMDDITKMISLTEGGDGSPSDAIDDSAMATLNEVTKDGLLGGGLANLKEKFGEEFKLENFEVQVLAGDAGSDLLAYIGDGPSITVFTFKADPHFDGTGYFVTSAAYEARVPGSADDDPMVSDDEMKDILSDFTPEQETGGYAGGGLGQENLDVILGIDLTATARLGNIEMPIIEVLNIGPGSIIEVGHLVDDPVELLVNGRLIARGDVVVVDEKFGLRITEIISPKERIESLR